MQVGTVNVMLETSCSYTSVQAVVSQGSACIIMNDVNVEADVGKFSGHDHLRIYNEIA